MAALLRVKNLNICFVTDDGLVKAGNNIELDMSPGTTVGLIGETGCGKSVLGHAILGVLPSNATISGRILYRGQNILAFSSKQMRQLRGKEIALIPQSPSTSLNPILKIGAQIIEAIRLHQTLAKREVWKKAVSLLRFFHFTHPEKTLYAFPHQLSGGMKQRILAAMGIAGNPALLIADEPTKGLDAIIQIHMMKMLKHLKETFGSALLIITHDLRIANNLCDEIAVMYAGEIVEHGTKDAVLNTPKHPYTKGLIASLPDNGLQPIPGYSPSLLDLPSGCSFHPRCSRARDECKVTPPKTRIIGSSKVRCRIAHSC